MPPKFSLGQLVATPGALDVLAEESFWPYIRRHASGDWGDVCDEDKAENELSLKHGFRLLSAYTLPSGDRIWIITEADRSSTTILLPEEY
jgi:hypothetical protein